MLTIKYIHSLDNVPQFFNIVEAESVRAELEEDMSYRVICTKGGKDADEFLLKMDSEDVVYVENERGKTTQTFYPVATMGADIPERP